MPIDFEVIPSCKLVVTKFFGRVTDHDAISTYARIVAHPDMQPGFSELAIHDDDFNADITREGLLEQIRIYSHFHGEHQVRSAGVVSKLSHEVLLNFIKSVMDEVEDSVEDMLIFGNIPDALEYLDIPIANIPTLEAAKFDFAHRLSVEQIKQENIALKLKERKALSHYQSLFDHANASCVVKLPEKQFIQVNDNFCELTGYSRGETHDLAISDLDAIQTEADIDERFQDLHKQQNIEFETKWLTKQGDVVDVIVNLFFIISNDEEYVQAICTDISKRKLKERELAHSKHDLELAKSTLEKTLKEKTRTEHKALHQEKLLSVIAKLQKLYIGEESEQKIFDAMLKEILGLTDSQYGFIHTLEHERDGTPFLQALAITNISWNQETQEFYEKMAPKGMRFYDFKALFGPAVTKGEIVISNYEFDDPRRKGTPEGHPSIDTFLAFPLFTGKKLLGVIGLANREQGYSTELVQDLDSIWSTSSQLIEAYKNNIELKKRSRQIEITLDKTDSGIWRHEPEKGRLFLDTKSQQLLGIPMSSCSFEQWQEVVHPDDLESHLKMISDSFNAKKDQINGSYRVVKKDGVRHLKVNAFVQYQHDKPMEIVGLLQDVTEYLEALSMLETAEQKYTRLIENLGSDFVVFSQDASTGQLLYLSPGFESVFGIPTNDAVGKHFAEVIKWSADVLEIAEESDGRLISGEVEEEIQELSFTHPNGELMTVSVTSHLIKNNDNTLLIEGIAENITEKKRLEEKLIQVATHDPLTGLYNRGEILNKLEHEISRAKRHHRPLSLLMLDLDYFKAINDEFGHQTGDKVLKAFANTVTSIVRNNDYAGRYGGEEFLVILPESSKEDASDCAERIRAAVQTAEVVVEQKKIGFTVSVGVTSYDGNIDTSKSLISRSDTALYQAKNTGRNCVVAD